MDGNNNHGYLQEDVSYDDLISGAGWPATTDQFSFPQPHQAQQAPYAGPYSSQTSFDHYDLQHQSYPSVSYTNSPYATTQPQYQHAGPSDVFGSTSYDLDPALQNASTYPADNSFSFGLHGTENHNTIAPQNLQYQIPSPQPPANHGVPNPAFQPTANDFNRRPQDQAPLYFSNAQNGNTQSMESSIQYPALPAGAGLEAKPSINYVAPNHSSSVPVPPRAQPVRSEAIQNTLRITDPELPATKNPSSRPLFPYAPFLSWQDVPIQVAPGLKNTLPKYHPRKSRSGKELVPGLDMSRMSTPARSSTKKIKAPKETKPSLSKYKGTSKGPKLVHEKLANLRGDDSGSVKSPLTPTETSSSEEDSSSEEESEYEEDEDMPVRDITEVRAATRPTDAAAAVGWDAIGIIWKDPNSNPNAEVIKDAIEKYANFVSALRVQLKANSTQTEEAASRPAEVDRLKRGRQILLESFYQTINAANTLGYPAIVENLGSHQKLVNGLTTTLIECIKADDFLGKLPKAVFSLLAKFQNMSDTLLKKLKFDSITKRWAKKGDEETKKDIASILANTTEAKEKVAKAHKEADQAEHTKASRDRVDQTKQRTPESVKAASNPAKRPHDGVSADKQPNKKFASDLSGAPSSSKPIPPKRPTNLLGISSKPVVKPAPKKREPSPPAASKLGALLEEIAKPVAAPKAPEAKPLPPETPEEKTRRERKESRRHLRVKFKEGPDLEEIRLFKHEQAEDEGRQDDMLRDAHDDRSEGMMHKQRVSDMDSAMDLDEDEYNPEDVIFEEHSYPDVVGIDFGDLDKTTRFGPTYATRGGEKSVATPEQEIQQRREALELMAVYTDPKDIPLTPKEPPHGDSGTNQQERQLKAPSEPWVVQRIQALQQYGPDYASQLLQHQKHTNAQENNGSLPARSSSLNPIAQFDGLSSRPSNQQNPMSSNAPLDRAAWEDLMRIVNSLKGKPYPPIDPPDWMTNPTQRAEWWEGYNRDKAAKEKKDADAQIAQLQAPQFQPPPIVPAQTHQPMMTAIVNPFPPPPPPNMASQAPDMAQQVQVYLAGLQGSSNGVAPPQQQYDYNGWSGGNQDHDEYGNRDQNRWDGDREKENARPSGKPGHNKSNSNSGKNRGYDMKQWSGDRNDSLFDENGEYKGKKKPCKFWMEGKCMKGAKCTYLHERE